MQARLSTILTRLGCAYEALHFAGCLVSARACLAARRFSMVLVDVGLPDGSGIDLVKDCRAANAAAPVLVITAWRQERVVLAALQAGADGYLLKERDDIEVALSIRSCLVGGAPIDPFVARRILELAAPAAASAALLSAPHAPQLTSRETEILGLVAKGLTNREIAEVLALSKLTVEVHVKNIYRKLAVGSRTEAVFEARGHGLLS
ncbi:two component transcriptional regulator, LuxR family [Bosea lathyri]|uniref:Two component transcriptional regulator, LuxR family n=2 Tax=Bosea lathyri TaxID=1036778 RepID=A0A1H5ZJ49_9HYPH|nr:two component transcriptional regulator, LuxR family [Bosea lathyri]